MKKLFILAAILSYAFGSNVIAEENAGDALIAQCQQQAIAAAAEDADSFVTNCINQKMQYDTSDD